MEMFPNDESNQKRLQKLFHDTTKLRMLEMRKNGTYTDVVFISEDGRKFNAHKLQLKFGSDYFVKMFDSNFKESRAKEIPMGMNGDILKLILDFLYFCPIEVSYLDREKLNELLIASNMLQLPVLIDQCWDRLIKTMTVDNYDVIWETAKMCDREDMEEVVVEFVINHLAEVTAKHKFYSLSCEKVMSVVKTIKSYEIPLEMFVVEGILSWVRNNVEDNKKYLKTFFANMDLSTFPESYIRALLASEDDLIREDQETIFAINSQLQMKKISRTNTENGLIKTCQLLRFTLQFGQGNCCSIDMDSGKKKTRRLPFVLSKGMCCAQYKQYLIFVGSYKYTQIPDNEVKQYGLNTVVQYCLETNIAEYKEPMPKPIYNAQACVVNETLFVIGGIRGMAKSIQYHDIIKNTWNEVVVPKGWENVELKKCFCIKDKLMIICHEDKDVYKLFVVDNHKCSFHSTLPKGFDLQPHLTIDSSNTLYGFVRQERQIFLCMYNFDENKWSTKSIQGSNLPNFVYHVFEVKERGYCIVCSVGNKIHILDSEKDYFRPMKLNAKCELAYFDTVPLDLDPTETFEVNFGFQKSLNQMKLSSRLQFLDDNLDDDLLYG